MRQHEEQTDEEIAMARSPKSLIIAVLRLLAAFWLLSCPQMGWAAGTWSVISLPQKPGEVLSTMAVAAEAAGNLYVADWGNHLYVAGWGIRAYLTNGSTGA